MSTIKKIIFSDLDGTLLDHFTYESIAAEKTLQQLKNIDIPVILNTSKTLAETEVIRQELQLKTPFIIENGAAVYIPVDTFYTQPPDTVTIGSYWVKSFCLPIQHWLELLSEHTTEFTSLFQGFSTLSDLKLSQLTGLSVEEAHRAKQRQYGEPVQWLSDGLAKNAFIEHMIDLGANITQGGRFLHVGGYCDKGQALIWLAEQYREQEVNNSLCTIALGDGENDTAMLEVADIAVQVRSPVHKFPTLHRQKMTLQTKQFGPLGWTEAIQILLANQLLSH